MLVRPGGVSAGLVDHAVDGVGADKVPGIDGRASVIRIAIELGGVDRGDTAFRQAGSGSAAVELGLVDVDAFVELSGPADDHAIGAGSGWVAVAGGVDRTG